MTFYYVQIQGTINARVFLSPLRDTRVHEILFGEIDDATGLATVRNNLYYKLHNKMKQPQWAC